MKATLPLLAAALLVGCKAFGQSMWVTNNSVVHLSNGIITITKCDHCGGLFDKSTVKTIPAKDKALDTPDGTRSFCKADAPDCDFMEFTWGGWRYYKRVLIEVDKGGAPVTRHTNGWLSGATITNRLVMPHYRYSISNLDGTPYVPTR